MAGNTLRVANKSNMYKTTWMLVLHCRQVVRVSLWVSLCRNTCCPPPGSWGSRASWWDREAADIWGDVAEEVGGKNAHIYHGLNNCQDPLARPVSRFHFFYMVISIKPESGSLSCACDKKLNGSHVMRSCTHLSLVSFNSNDSHFPILRKTCRPTRRFR